ncbi:uncharacterized protein LOC130731346 isoform X2 [Lotus japonicus]|nr:uncharacterized protein LOC130731346 isoform X2 [Lotus japonicus]
MPITQYFESARQAGLVNRYSSSSGESDPCNNVRVDHDLYSVDFKKKPLRNMPPSTLRKGMRNRERRYPVKEGMNMRKQQGKVWDVTEHPRKHHDSVPPPAPPRAPKPVDEDLYKIPPELLRRTKRKKMLGFISKCLVPAACVS